MIRCEVIRDKVKVTTIEDKMRANIFIWSGHVKSNVDAVVRRCETINFEEHRKGK